MSGPAQKAVMSRTRSPANGSAVGPAAGGVRGGIPRRAISSMESRPSRGAAVGRSKASCAEPEGRSRIRGAIPWVDNEGLPLSEMLDGGDIRAVGDRCVRDPEGRREVEHLLDGVRADPPVDGRPERRAIEKELRILHPLRVFDHGAEVEPLLPGAAPEADQPVARCPDARRRHESLLPHRAAELVVEGHRVVREGHRQRLEHRHVDELAARFGAPARGQGPDGAEHAGDPLPDLATHEDRSTVGPAPSQPHDRPGPRLQRELGGRLVAPGAVESERCDRGDRQVRVPAENLAGRQRRVLCHRGTAGPHGGVGRGEQSLQRGEALGARVLDDHALLRGVEEIEERAVGVG